MESTQQKEQPSGAQPISLEAIRERIEQLTSARKSMVQGEVLDSGTLKVYRAVEQRLAAQEESCSKVVAAPPLSWVREQLKIGHYPVYYRLLEGYLINSPDDFPMAQPGDLCISVVVPARSEISSLEASERYQRRFPSPRYKPCWHGRVVHIRFFYPGETINGTVRALEPK